MYIREDDKKYLEALEKELNLLQQQKDNLLHKQARAKTDNEIKYWQFRIDKFNYLDRNSINKEDCIVIKEGDPLWKPLLLDLIDYYKDKLNKLNNYVKDLLTPKEED